MIMFNKQLFNLKNSYFFKNFEVQYFEKKNFDCFEIQVNSRLPVLGWTLVRRFKS